MPEPKWIRFALCPAPPERKTKLWDVIAKDGDTCLGLVAWYGGWRCYTFRPVPGTEYEPTCLGDIAAFVEARTLEHRQARNAAREKEPTT